MAQSSTLVAMLTTRCPRCHQGELFSESILNPARFDKMYTHCPVCGLLYERELGFYWGAMYFSYFLSVLLVLIVGMSLNYLAGDPDTWIYITVVVTAIILFTPLLFRYSRVLMLYLFGGVNYNPDFQKSE